MSKLNDLISTIRSNHELKRRLFITILILTLFRVITLIPVPGVDVSAIKNVFASNQLLSLDGTEDLSASIGRSPTFRFWHLV